MEYKVDIIDHLFNITIQIICVLCYLNGFLSVESKIIVKK